MDSTNTGKDFLVFSLLELEVKVPVLAYVAGERSSIN